MSGSQGHKAITQGKRPVIFLNFQHENVYFRISFGNPEAECANSQATSSFHHQADNVRSLSNLVCLSSKWIPLGPDFLSQVALKGKW